MSRHVQLAAIFTHIDTTSVLALTTSAPGLHKYTLISKFVFLQHFSIASYGWDDAINSITHTESSAM